MDPKSNLSFVSVEIPLPNTSAKGKLRNSFDITTNEKLYEGKLENIPIIYNYIYKLYREKTNKINITMSFDKAISSASISGIAERYMQLGKTPDDKPNYYSNLKIIYINCVPDLKNIDSNDNFTMQNIGNTVISNLLSINNITYTKHNILISPDQIIFVGLNELMLSDEDLQSLQDNGLEYYSLQTIRKLKLTQILTHIVGVCDGHPVHIVFNLGSCNVGTAPCTVKQSEIINTEGFSIDELKGLATGLSKVNIVGVDVTNYDLRIEDTNILLLQTCDTVRVFLKNLLNITEKKINIYNEHSRFLIWKPMDETDVGWYILRNVPTEIKLMLLEKLKQDDIITFELNELNYGDVYISSTTCEEQDLMSYAVTDDNDHFKCVLYPEEKISMKFELIN